MSCEEIIREIPLYYYGEVSSETEENVEAHLAECSACREELARHRAFMEALDGRPQLSDAGMLAECRANLRAEIARESEAVPRPAPWKGWVESLREFSRMHIPFRVPVGAMALMAVGFFAARFTGDQGGPMFSTVRSIEADAAGNVQISVDEVRRHLVKGSARDPQVQELLLNAAHEESNPGLRSDSISMLRTSADSQAVRTALIEAATKDPSSAVRLKALEGLKAFVGDTSVRRTLASALLQDEDPGVRMEAIELLTSSRDDALVGVLQSAVQHEDNDYIRSRCRRLLAEMKASLGTY